MRSGLDWYKREPQRYLGGVQGLTTKEHAVYSVVLDLIYLHGGSVNNDPKWIAGWISDMGSAAVRKAILSLVERGKLTFDGDQITQKRAKNEAKTKEKLTETRRKSGKKGGEKSAEIRATPKENNALSEPSAETESQPEKIREDKSTSVTNVTAQDPDKIMFDSGTELLVASGKPVGQAKSFLGKMRKQYGTANVIEAIGRARREAAIDPEAFMVGCLKHVTQKSDSEQFGAFGRIPVRG